MPHIHKLIDFTVGIFVVHEGRALLIYHKKLKRWLSVGGHIELDENPEQALFRELKEESGLDASAIEMLSEKPSVVYEGREFLYTPSYLDFHPIEGQHWHVGLVYFAKAKSDKVVLAPDEHDEIRWFTEAELESPDFGIPPDVQFLAKEALKRART